MDFSRYQQDAARSIRLMTVGYGVAVLGVVLVFNGLAAFAWSWVFRGASLPYGFVAINTLATAGLIIGGSWIEIGRLRHDSGLLAERLGATALEPGASGLTLLERRAINVLEELALGARLPIPRLYVLRRDGTINALAAGMSREDATIILTQGAVDRLTRSELQGVVGHEIAHLLNGDVIIHTQLVGMNFGLELVANLGRKLTGDLSLIHYSGSKGDNLSVIRLLFLLPGLVLRAVGSIGHLAALLLTAAMGRSREMQADALAVRLTREPKALGNALRKIVWLIRRGQLPPQSGAALHGLEHAMFHQPGVSLRAWFKPAWFDTHPPLASRIERLLGPAAAREINDLEAVRGDADEAEIAQDLQRSAAWLASSALPPLAFSSDIPDSAAPAAAAAPEAQTNAPARQGDLVALVAATRDAYDAAALCALLILGSGRAQEAWPNRWRAAWDRQASIAERLIVLGPTAVEGLRWALLEMCAATLRPLAEPWRDELLRMLRGQIELDDRVTLTEWIYYMLLRARLMPQRDAAWRGDENAADPAEAVRWVVSLLAEVTGELSLRGERLATDLVRELGLSRTGHSHPPHDIGGLQAAVTELRRMPMLRRPLLVRRLAEFLNPDAPVEARDFVRVLALIIDSPMPVFEPLNLTTPDVTQMATELTGPRRLGVSL